MNRQNRFLGLIAAAAVAAVASFWAPPAQAQPGQSWFYIQDSVDGERLLGLRNSLQLMRNKRGIDTVSAVFAFVQRGERVEFEAATAVTSCASGGGELAMAVDGSVEIFHWDQRGRKMYDAIGSSLCAALRYQQQQQRPQTPRTPAPLGSSVNFS